MLALIEHAPDIYLDEIQEQLQDLHDVDISLATIWRTLKRLGIGSKKVLTPFHCLWHAHKFMYNSCPGQLPSDAQRHVVNLHWRLGKNRPNTLCAPTRAPSTF